METIFQQRAKALWPEAQITGSGKYAAVFHCCPNKVVRLFEAEFLAWQAARADCGHAHCRMEHTVAEMRSPVPDNVPDMGYPD